MEVALLVFPLHYSHGCILQTYALYSKLKDLGCTVTILDRQPEEVSLLRCCFLLSKRIVKFFLKGYKGAIFYKGRFPKQIMVEQKPFIDTFRHDIVSVHSSEELRRIVQDKKFDAIVVGSDQIWRPYYVPNVMDYWLDFAFDIPAKKVAYASSFGVDEWEYTLGQTAKCRQLAAMFNAISVREESGVRLCKEHLGVDVKHVLDPTLLWDKSFYTPIAKKKPLESGFCQCYFLDQSPEKVSIANQVARILNLKLNFINTRTEDGNAPVEERIAPSIEKWLAGFHYGDFIVVDSFHAMAFSIIFQKPFIVIGNIERGLSRFESLLKEFNLLDRLILDKETDLDSIITSLINWELVNERLAKKRRESSYFLSKSLKLTKNSTKNL